MAEALTLIGAITALIGSLAALLTAINAFRQPRGIGEPRDRLDRLSLVRRGALRKKNGLPMV